MGNIYYLNIFMHKSIIFIYKTKVFFYNSFETLPSIFIMFTMEGHPAIILL